MSQDQNLEHSRKSFEQAKRESSHGAEYWSARDLMPLLGYDTWRRFQDAIDRAKTSCSTFGQSADNHFAGSGKMVAIGSSTQREVEDYFLSRYACYLIAQNGDSAKPEVAAAQAYFALQTFRQEMRDQSEQISDEDLRITERLLLSANNRNLTKAAELCGVTGPGFGSFHDAGYKGLYNGRSVQDLKTRKGLMPKDQYLDHIGLTELAANNFRATQAKEKLEREKVNNAAQATIVHHEAGKIVRKAIQESGNILPEDLPVEPNIKPLLAKRQKQLKQLGKAQNQRLLPDDDARKQ